jgi:hypothetical protein
MRKLGGKLDYAIKLKDSSWALVYDGKLQKKTYPSADAAESAYSDKEGKR